MDLRTYLIREKRKTGAPFSGFAAKIGISRAYLTWIMTGKKLPSFPLGEKIEKQSNLEVTYEDVVKFYRKKNNKERIHERNTPN